MGRAGIAALCALVVAALCPAVAPAAPVGALETRAWGLRVPWDVLGLPDGRTLVPERSESRIRVIEPDGTRRGAPAWSEPSADKVLGIAAHPGYATNRFVYVYVTYPSGSEVLRLVDDGVDLRTDRVIFDRPIGTDGNHDGGRSASDPTASSTSPRATATIPRCRATCPCSTA